jgi:hypothetical protein
MRFDAETIVLLGLGILVGHYAIRHMAMGAVKP